MANSGGRTLQTADNALRILGFLGESNQSRSLAEVARALGLAKSVAHNLLYTLRQRGFVHQDPRSREYILGLQLVTLGQAAAMRLDLRSIARPYMEELAALTAESAYLMVPGRNMVVLIDRADPPNPIRVTMEVGQEGYFHAGSSNKAILSFLPDDEIHRIIRDVGLPALTPDTPTDPEALWIQIRMFRKQFYVYTEQESFEGVAGLSVPIFDRRSQVVGSLGVAGLIQRLRPRKQELSGLVIKAAAAISKALGHPAGGANPYGTPAEEVV